MTDQMTFDGSKVRNADMYASDLKSALNFIIEMYAEFTKVPDDYIPLIRDVYNQIRFYADCLHDLAIDDVESRTFYNQS